MRAQEILAKKRDGGVLTEEEIRFFVNGVVRGEIPDYQAAAFLMAAYVRGLTDEETLALTLAMADSGEKLDLSSVPGFKMDKHSTGGVGDKLTLVVLPMVAAVGIPVAKLSGRALGHTGGTIDKLESIPGFRTNLTPEEIVRQVEDIGLAVAEPGEEIVPADKIFYALRDVTATVDSKPLIVASILSKKLAGGADGFVFDVKAGSGAFMPTEEDARELATLLVRISKKLGKRATAILTNMIQPHGYEIGNANEVREAIEVLKGGGPDDVKGAAVRMAAEMALLAGKAETILEAVRLVDDTLASGAALEKFAEWVERQGGDPRVVDDYELLPQPEYEVIVGAEREGILMPTDARLIGEAVMLAGGGRRKKGDPIDHAAGVTLYYRGGSKIFRGDALARMVSTQEIPDEAVEKLVQAFKVTDEDVTCIQTVIDVVRDRDLED